MKNELIRILLQSNLTEEEIYSCEYRLRTFGSPYTEIEEAKIQPGQTVYVNPYNYYYKVLEPLLETDEFLKTPEGQLLFHELIKEMIKIDQYQGMDRYAVKKELLRRELLEGAYGKHISRFFGELNVMEQNITLDNLLQMYERKENIYSFVSEAQLLFPKCIIFREHKNKNKLYVYLGIEKRKDSFNRYKAIADMFLPGNITVYVTWEQPFVLTDWSKIENRGNRMV